MRDFEVVEAFDEPDKNGLLSPALSSGGGEGDSAANFEVHGLPRLVS
jgi:hypothetical protein